MSGFKLLAIRPLEGCDPKFLKVLTEGEIYQFYNDYTFIRKDEGDIHSAVKEIKYKSSIPGILYKIGDTNINISAIVGKNGSGKSSLMELLFVSVFLLSMQENILKNHSKEGESLKDSLIALKGELEKLINDLEQIYLNDKFLPIKQEQDIDSEKEARESVYEKLNLDQRIKWKSDEINKLSKLIEEYALLKKHIKVEIFYQISNTIFKLKIDSKQEGNHSQIECVKTNIENKETDVCENKRNLKIDNILNNPYDLSSYFFYSLVLNYSQYALNSKEIGDWIIELFHKNDGYQTPIVINPMRKEGNFDINRENDLVKQRLLVNVLTPLNKDEKIEESLRHLAQNHIAHRIKITLNKEKFKNDKNLKDLKYIKKYPEVWKTIEEVFFNKKTIGDKKWNEYAKDYIIGKLISMAEKYPPYYKYYDNNDFKNLTIEDKNTGYLDTLKNDKSHIAYKFHQAINFLKYNYSELYLDSQKSGSISKIAEELSEIENIDLMHLIPPSFLIVDILFDEKIPDLKKDEKESNTLFNLSSGEKQHIYSISSIMYHLRYLDSVKVSEKKEEDEHKEKGKNELKYKYKYINLVFDEIELYYHPELQRQFINDFRNAVGRCNLKYIKNINCTFITHSPFILSDILRENTLFLRLNKKGKSTSCINNETQNTFGANINEMLISNFFMSSTLGEFAEELIHDIVKFHELVKKAEDKTVLETLKLKYEVDYEKRYNYIVNSIGDEVIQNILRNNLINIESILNRENPIVTKKRMLEAELDKLESQIQKGKKNA